MFASLEDARVVVARVELPAVGTWTADVDLDAPRDFAGKVTLTIGDLVLLGTVHGERSGTFGLASKYSIHGGAGAWGNVVKAKGYHSDLGVKRANVLQDLAREVGETLVVDSLGGADRLPGVDYLRIATRAGTLLSQLMPAGIGWWVGTDGVTHVGTRAAGAVVPEAFELLDYDASKRVAVGAVERPASVVPGLRVERPQLARPLVIRSVTLSAGAQMRAALYVREAA